VGLNSPPQREQWQAASSGGAASLFHALFRIFMPEFYPSLFQSVRREMVFEFQEWGFKVSEA
jgi:hypothetical protein